MTITIVCDILGEENNGTTIACMNLIRFLHAQGHTVRVVCADQDKAGNECFYVVPELNLYLLNPIVERNGVTLPRVDKALLEDAIRDCDVVHTTFVLQLSHTAVKIAKAYNKPITSSFHCQAENVTAHFLCKDLDAINRGVYRACYQMVYQYSDIIHYPTQFIRDTFEAVVGPTNGRVISNGVNSMFTPGPAKRRRDWKASSSSSRPAACRAKRIRRSSSTPSAARPTASRSTSSSPVKAPARSITVIWRKNTVSTWRSRFSRGRIC